MLLITTVFTCHGTGWDQFNAGLSDRQDGEDLRVVILYQLSIIVKKI